MLVTRASKKREVEEEGKEEGKGKIEVEEEEGKEKRKEKRKKEGIKCFLCHNPLDSSENKTLVCGHTFHKACITSRCKGNDTDECPQCKRQIHNCLDLEICYICLNTINPDESHKLDCCKGVLHKGCYAQLKTNRIACGLCRKPQAQPPVQALPPPVQALTPPPVQALTPPLSYENEDEKSPLVQLCLQYFEQINDEILHGRIAHDADLNLFKFNMVDRALFKFCEDIDRAAGSSGSSYDPHQVYRLYYENSLASVKHEWRESFVIAFNSLYKRNKNRDGTWSFGSCNSIGCSVMGGRRKTSNKKRKTSNKKRKTKRKTKRNVFYNS